MQYIRVGFHAQIFDANYSISLTDMGDIGIDEMWMVRRRGWS